MVHLKLSPAEKVESLKCRISAIEIEYDVTTLQKNASCYQKEKRQRRRNGDDNLNHSSAIAVKWHFVIYKNLVKYQNELKKLNAAASGNTHDNTLASNDHSNTSRSSQATSEGDTHDHTMLASNSEQSSAECNNNNMVSTTATIVDDEQQSEDSNGEK